MSAAVGHNIQIIKVLCDGAASEAAVLAALQTRYPASHWTANYLADRLALGVRRGLFKKVGTSPYGPVQGYAINQQAIFQNFGLNKVYGGYCSQIKLAPVRVFN